MIALAIALLLQAAPTVQTAPVSDCSLSSTDLIANRALTFEQFDQYQSTL
jgi:hypothetical protein